jgi:hypothetical protein
MPSLSRCVTSARACRRRFRIPPTTSPLAPVDLHHPVSLPSPRASPTSKSLIISSAITFMLTTCTRMMTCSSSTLTWQVSLVAELTICGTKRWTILSITCFFFHYIHVLLLNTILIIYICCTLYGGKAQAHACCRR